MEVSLFGGIVIGIALATPLVWGLRGDWDHRHRPHTDGEPDD
ncbi:hypothetical protein [Nocardia colli]|nr:hypothetical protein [Nocardia colli]